MNVVTRLVFLTDVFELILLEVISKKPLGFRSAIILPLDSGEMQAKIEQITDSSTTHAET